MPESVWTDDGAAIVRASDEQDRINIALATAMGAELAEDGPGFLADDPAHAVAGLAEGTNIDPRDVQTLARIMSGNVQRALNEGLDPGAVLHGVLVNAILVGYRTRQLEDTDD